MAELDPRQPDERGVPPARHERSGSTGRSATVGRDNWPASASFGWLVGTVLLLICGVAVVLVVVHIPATSGGQRLAWIAIAAALTVLTIGIAVLLRALPTMRYRFTDDALVVEWLGERRVVRLDEIVDVTYQPRQPLRLPRWEPFWPGYYVATVRSSDGTWHSWATQQPRRRVRILTQRGIVAISPERPVRFVAELERRIRLLAVSDTVPSLPEDNTVGRPDRVIDDRPAGQVQDPIGAPVRQRAVPAAASRPIARWATTYRDLFRDQLLADQISSALVALGLVLPVLMAAYLYSQFEGLPEQIPIRWDAGGDLAETATPGGLWRFPRIAITILVANTVLATLLVAVDKYLARLLLAGVPVAQVILFVALVRAVN